MNYFPDFGENVIVYNFSIVFFNFRQKRSDWKWATERTAVASRWTWLQAQVSDLEYRIRQQSEIYKQIRHTKGSVVLGDVAMPEDLSVRLRQGKELGNKMDSKHANLLQNKESASPACNISNVLMNVNLQASKLTKSLGTLSPATHSTVIDDKSKTSSSAKTPNGMIGTSGHEHGTPSSSVAGETAPSTPDIPRLVPVGPSNNSSPNLYPLSAMGPPDVLCHAARCRPVKSYRKRKLLKTAGLHQVNRKAARLSTVKCQCYPPMTCPMCGGRYNNVQNIDADTMPTHERVAIMDPSFHPVLSFTQGKLLNY